MPSLKLRGSFGWCASGCYTPKHFEDELYALQLRAELKRMHTQELEHLETEVKVGG